jgi:hypothetical protein
MRTHTLPRDVDRYAVLWRHGQAREYIHCDYLTRDEANAELNKISQQRPDLTMRVAVIPAGAHLGAYYSSAYYDTISA